MLRIVHVALQLGTGGMERLLVEFARCADRSRVSLQFVSLTTGGVVAREIEALGWPVSVLEAPPGLRPGLALRLSRLFREWGADVVHTHNTKPLLYAGPAARLAGARVVHTRHGQRAGSSARQDALFSLACRCADRVVGVCAEVSQRSLAEGVHADSIRTLHNGIDLARFPFRGPARGGPALFVGRLSPEKDVQTLLHAVAMLVEHHPGFRLHIAGTGACETQLRSLARDLKIERHVGFLGEVHDVPSLLAGASMLVLPSTTEGLSLCVLEAMATGLPIVATRVGGTPEAARDGVDGVLVPVGDARVLADAMERVFADASLSEKMGHSGRQRAHECFDVRHMVRRYEGLYEEVARRLEKGARGTALNSLVHRSIILPAFETVLKGRKTLRYWAQLERSQWLPAASIERMQVEKLRSLLTHAAAHCPYYANEWRRLGVTSAPIDSLADLARYPIITRETIRTNRVAMRAPGLRLLSKSTGGSSGEPLRFDLDTDSHERRTAAAHRGYAWAGAAPGTRQVHLWGVPLGERSVWARAKDRLYHAMHRRTIVDCFSMDDALADRFVREIERIRPDAIVAYTSPLYDVARRLERQGRRPGFSPRTIIVGAEKLYDFQREAIERAFGAPVFETYGSREVMLIGAECERHDGLHLTSEHLIVELLDDHGQPVPVGTEGNVVVTDLHNYGMPFIRYATGDRAVAEDGACACGRGMPRLREVVGRRLDILHASGGRVIPGEFFPHLVKDFPDIRRFQVVQEEARRVRFSLQADAMSTAARATFEDQVREAFGPDVRVEFEAADHIPLTPMGKRQVVINRVHREDAA